MLEKNGITPVSISLGTLIRVVLVALGVFLIWYLRDLVLVILTSIVIASFVESAVPHFKKLRLGRVTGIVILYAISLLSLAGLFYLFAPLLIVEIYNISNVISSFIPGIDFIDYFRSETFSQAKDIVAGLPSNLSLSGLLETSTKFITNLSGGFFQTLAVAFGSIVNVVLIVIVSFYFSIQEKGIENFLRLIFPIKNEEYVVDLWQRTRRKIALWLRGQALLGLIIGVLTYLVLMLLGSPYALLLAIIAGITELVPYGVLIALIPAVSFSYIDGGITSALMVAGAYLIIHQFEAFLFSPLIMRSVVGLSPLIVILSALIGFELGGFWGLVLAIPGAVFFMEIASDIEKHKIFTRNSSELKNEH
ncbi:MAG: AI-2E family transporter [Candidatus Paceibacterota bacterium]|jgi:predicted PurR-regulated permease PerM